MSRFDCSEARRCLDQDAAGVVTDEDRRALETHLSFCESCRAEHEVWELAVLTASRVAPPPSREGSVIPLAEGSGALRPGPRRRRPTPLALVAVLVVLLLGGTALATVLAAPWRDGAPRESGSGTIDPAPGRGAASPDGAPPGAAMDPSPVDREGEATGVPRSRADLIPAREPTATEPTSPLPAVSPHPGPPALPDGKEGQDGHSLVAIADPGAGTEAATIEQLLLRAREHRARHRYTEACEVYGEVVTAYPGNQAAANARIALGQLLLGPLERPADALVHFDGYLDREPTGALAEDARVGRVLARPALSDLEQVVAACDDYLAHHPDGNAVAEVLLSRADARRAGGDCVGALLDYAVVLDRWGDSPHATMAAAGVDACEGR